MSYILPLPHFQYSSYHSRVIQDKQNPYFIDKLYQAKFNAKARDQERRADTHKRNKNLYAPTRIQRIADDVEKTHANVTGKGRYFSESI